MIFKGIMRDQLKDELVKGVSEKIEENIPSVGTAFEVKQEEISEPQVYTKGELRKLVVCKEVLGFMVNWLECSLILDKWYPEGELAPWIED